MSQLKVTHPCSEKEFEGYYKARFDILRAPWGQPEGSEKDDHEDSSIHFMAVKEGKIVGVCRLQNNLNGEFQIRYMGVYEEYQGQGIGRLLIQVAEEKAKFLAGITVILQARENAIEFYRSCGYSIIEKSYLMWGVIQHYLMKKEVKNSKKSEE